MIHTRDGCIRSVCNLPIARIVNKDAQIEKDTNTNFLLDTFQAVMLLDFPSNEINISYCHLLQSNGSIKLIRNL